MDASDSGCGLDGLSGEADGSAKDGRLKVDGYGGWLCGGGVHEDTIGSRVVGVPA